MLFAIMFTWLCVQWFKLKGWTIKSEIPPDLKKFVIIVAPHTSFWDFPVGVAVRKIRKMDYVHFIAKKELFRFPFNSFFRKLGGYPVDRSKKTNLVDAIVDIFNSKDRFGMAITPEGTRNYNPDWKTGFYRIAAQLNIPIIMASVDYSKHEVEFSAPTDITNNMEADIVRFKAFFIDKKGKFPEQGVKG